MDEHPAFMVQYWKEVEPENFPPVQAAIDKHREKMAADVSWAGIDVDLHPNEELSKFMHKAFDKSSAVLASIRDIMIMFHNVSNSHALDIG